MDILYNALNGGGWQAWLILFAVIVIGIILLRVIFEIASTIIRIGCAIFFVLVIAYILFTFFGGS